MTALCLAWAAGPAGAAPSFTEASFESVPLATGLDLPTDVTWAPDGRMFIAEKEGYVRVVEKDGALLANPIVDIHDHVIPYGDRGLIGIAVAPVEASTNVTLYLLYDHGSPVGASDETVATATLTSVTVEADNKVVGGKVVGGKEGVDPTEATILGSVNSPGAAYGSACASESLDCIPSDGFTHSIGTVLVDPKDGSLWVGSGDGLNDFGEENPTPSPLHIRAQNPESLAGKILHIHPNGEGFANSPFCSNKADTTSNCSKVYAMGFRNPFRFTLRQLGGETVPVVGDVGEGHWEKLDLVNSRGFNAGWPCYEGNEENPDFAGTTQCKTLGASYNRPLFVYTHYSDECTYPGAPAPPECDKNQLGAAIAATTIYEGGQPGSEYPAAYVGKLFIADYVHGWMSAVNMAEPPTLGISNGSGMPLFAQHLGELVDSARAPNGDIVYVTLSVNSETALGLGTVQEIRYAPEDKSPVAEPVAESSCVNATSGATIHFIGDGSYDPDGDTSLSYHWDFGDGTPPSSEANPVHTYAKDGDYIARLIVTDSKSNSASGFLAVHIHAGQTGQPAAEISFPEVGREYIAGKKVQLSGGDHGAPGVSWQWQVARHEGADVLGAMPPFETGSEYGSAEFETATSPPSTLSYVLHFVTSTGICTTTESRTLEPQRGELTLAAQDQSGGPLAVPLTLAGKPATPAPFTLTVVKNMLAHVAAPPTFTAGGNTYEFQDWSDGGAREHEARLFEYPTHAAEETQTLTAVYVKVAPPSSPSSGGSSSGTSGGGGTSSGGGSSSGGLPNLGEPLGKVFLPPAISLGHIKPHRPTSLQGTVSDPAGVRSVRVAIRPQRIRGKGCMWWSQRRRGFVQARQGCNKIQWLTARLRASGSVTRWTVTLGGALPKGRYLLLVQALDSDGRSSSRFANVPSGLLVVR